MYAQSLFINGLLTILPLALTFAILSVTYNLIRNWILNPVHSIICLTPLGTIPYIDIIISVALILLIGSFIRIFILRSLIEHIEHIIIKIPFVRPIYSNIKQLVQTFSNPAQNSQRTVVIIPFGQAGSYSLGFKTNDISEHMMPNQDKYAAVFIPTTPNPTSGFLVFVPHTHIKQIDMTSQEAMTFIVSGGIVYPDRFMDEIR
jgi:uncharacterized membrane protein